MERHLNFARNLHIETRILGGQPVAAPSSSSRGGTGHSRSSSPARAAAGLRCGRFSRDLVQSIVSLAKDMQVVIVSDRQPLKRNGNRV